MSKPKTSKVDEAANNLIELLLNSSTYKRYKKDLREDQFIAYDMKNLVFFTGLKSSRKIFKSCIYMAEFDGDEYRKFKKDIGLVAMEAKK